MRQPFSGTAEQIFMKLLPNGRGENGVSNAVSKWGLGPQIILGAKNWKIAIGAYSSELITPERKRISERLKWMLNHKTMAYKVYVRPWPLTPRGKHSVRFCMYKCKKFQVLAILSKFSAVTPRQSFTVNSPRGALQVWIILWTLTYKRRWTIRLKHWDFLRSAVCQEDAG